MKVALVHDHLMQYGGAEKVLYHLQEIFPDAPTYTLVYDPDKVGQFLYSQNIKTSFIQKMPLSRKKYQWYLPLMPLATEHYNLNDYQLIISSSSAFSKGVIPAPQALHFCYCHTPTRYLWSDRHQYLKELKVNPLVKKIVPMTLARLRQWDRMAVDRVDYFIANSQTVQQRIKKYYQRDSQVIYPPVDVAKYKISDQPKKYFLTGGRLVSYKRFDIAVKAFNRLNMPLKIYGNGPEAKNLKKIARNNIEFLGFVAEEQKIKLFENCLAFINPQLEDFGITPVEAMAAGRPVIAYGFGGAKESVIDNQTGMFFYEQTWEELADAIIHFLAKKFEPKVIKNQAENFSQQNFKNSINRYIEAVLEKENKI